ncbi:lebercilin-like protein isoform X1 [Hemicordylus capensis]|uniref:lebercilin-like protein isoform X1 n=1 Tax=Hemicordylus capensis TaxID=884348 RepID=UPI00230344E1|nr:lebercilin-like protein isoform X1 [Hemicordylus capensis]
MYSSNRMTASDDCFLRFIVQEENKCEQCPNSENPTESPSRNYKGSQSNSGNKINNSSKCTSQCGSGSFQLDYSNDFQDHASTRASSSSSSCSEQNNCGSSQNYYYEDFHTDSSETSSSSGGGGGGSSSGSSHCNNNSEQPETKEEESPKEKKENDHQAKGNKPLPKKKKQQKSSFGTDNITNSQNNSNVAHRILSARLRKVKETKNEVCVLKNKLEASNMENQLLKRLQYRHLKAISKYENAETNLPDLMAKHYDEVRTLRALLRKSQEQERNASRRLREVEAQLLKTQDTLQALQKLSEDKNLAERGELKNRLTALAESMEASDKRIQGLERQLQLNNTSFSHQLAVEKKNTVEARTITTKLQMEIKLLNQKIKEKERELGIRNIYANRLLKGQKDKGDTESPPKDINVNKSIQVDMSFDLEAMAPLQKHETEKSTVLKKEMTTKAINSKNKSYNAPEDMKLKTDIPQTEKLLMQELSSRTCTELLREEIHLSVEQQFKCKNLERQKKRRDGQGINLLKEEFEKLRTARSFQPTHDVLQKENTLEETTVEKQENKENKRSGEPKEVIHDKLAILTQRHKTPSKLKKQYVFTEAIENLHQGFPSSGPTSNKNCNSRQVNSYQSEIAEFKAGNAISAYEPSFGRVTKTRQNDTLVHVEDHIPTVSMEKKNTLMEELFGPSCILKDSHPNSHLKEVVRGKKTLQSERISYINDSLQCGDSKQAQIKVFHAMTSLEDLK